MSALLGGTCRERPSATAGELSELVLAPAIHSAGGRIGLAGGGGRRARRLAEAEDAPAASDGIGFSIIVPTYNRPGPARAVPDGARRVCRPSAPPLPKWPWLDDTGALRTTRQDRSTRSQSGWTSPSWQRRTPVRRRPANLGALRTLTDDTRYSPTMIASRRPVGFALSTLARMPFRGPARGRTPQRAPRYNPSTLPVSQMVIEVVYAHYNADPDQRPLLCLEQPCRARRPVPARLEGSIPTSPPRRTETCASAGLPRGRLTSMRRMRSCATPTR